MRRTSSILVVVLVLVVAACSERPASIGGGASAVPREVLFATTSEGPVTIEVPSGTVRFERAGALASADGTRVYAAASSAGRTVVETNDAVSGALLSRSSVDGVHTLAVVSGSGRAAALVDPLPTGWDPALPVPRSSTSIVVADPTGRAGSKTFRLRGNYEPEAFSVDDRQLFLIQHLPAEAPTVYRVTVLDLRRGIVYPVIGPYKGPPERMPGTRLEQVPAPDGARLYTLYSSSRPGFAPHGAPVPANADVSFVHVLDLREGWAHCVGLPRPLWDRPAAEQALAVSPDGSTLFVVDAAAGVVVAMDAATLETRVATSVGFGAVSADDAAAQVSADGRTLFVAATGDESTLFAVDTETLVVAHRWDVDGPVSGLGLSADGERLYVALGHGVEIVDPSTGGLLADVPLDATGPVVRLAPIAA